MTDTRWELRIAEHYAWGGIHHPTWERTGGTATIFHSAGPHFWGAPKWSEAWFYANGDLLAYAKCP